MALKIYRLPLSCTMEQLREVLYCGDEEHKVIHIKNTDVLIIKKCTSSYFYLYSKKVRFGGIGLGNDFGSQLMNKGFNYRQSFFYEGEWNNIKRVIDKYKFTQLETEVEKDVKDAWKKVYTVSERQQRYPEYGVELEVESDNYMESETKNKIANSSELIDNFGDDCSVYNGGEIRFKHPRMSGWKLKDIELVLNQCKEAGAKTNRGTAGMHIHISRKNIRLITKKFSDNLRVMQDILYPINCRNLQLYNGGRVSYGVDSNIYRNQNVEFGTLEIRAWNSTLDPKLFLARIKFCKTLTDWLKKTNTVSIKSFFDYMNKSEKDNYKFMLNHKENPHEWGFPPAAINALLA